MVPSDFYPALSLPLFVLILEPARLLFLVYMLLCVVAAGFDGIAVGVLYWVLFSVVRLVWDFLGMGRLAYIRGGGR